MKILVTGANGQVGKEIRTLSLDPRFREDDTWEWVFVSRAELDIAQQSQVDAVISQHQPTVVINTAAYTNVDLAEKEPELAHAVNVDGPRYLAQACQKHGCILIHFSTDYIFDGRHSQPYLETDSPNPLGVYGRTKLLGEQAVQQYCDKHLIFRVTWVFGRYAKNFVSIMLQLMADREEISVVSDQIACPTAGSDIAKMLVRVIPQLTAAFKQWGIYHYAGLPVVSRFEFAQAIMSIAQEKGGKIKRILPVTTDHFPTPAERPLYSVLDSSKIKRIFGVNPSDWQQALVEQFK